MKKQKNIILIGSLILILILLFIFTRSNESSEQQVSVDEPVDIVSDFYTQWLIELKSSDTDPYKSGLSKSPILSPELRKKIKKAERHSENTIDPVLCQTSLDIDIATRRVYESEDEVQILVTARDKSLTAQSLMTVLKHNEGWFINDIQCRAGEFEEEREFTFEREGFLIKGSTLESLDPETWYIIFEENGQPGHDAPLIFSGESMCLDKKDKGDVCVPDTFTEVTKISVQGTMTEGGVEVKNMKFI